MALRFPLLLLIFSIVPVSGASVQDGPEDVPDTQFGDIHFKVPTGWNPVEKGSSFLIVAPAPSPGSVTVIALASNPLNGDLAKSFDQLLAGLRRSYQITQQSQVVPTSDTEGNNLLYTNAAGLDSSGKKWSASLIGVQYGQRFESIVFLSDISPGSTYDSYFKVFQSFLSLVSFGDSRAGSKGSPNAGRPDSRGLVGDTRSGSARTEIRPRLAPGALEGIYASLGFGVRGVRWRRLIFSGDGWVVKDIPQEGMIGFDFTAYRTDPHQNRNFIGRYHVDGDKIVIDWQDFRGPGFPPDREAVRRDEVSAHPAYVAGWDTFIPMCRCTGKKLSGKYIWGSAAADQYLQFFPDGTFIDHRVTDQLIVPSAFYSNPRIQRGTYSIQDQTLVFNFSDGHRGARTFMAPKAQENQPVFEWIGLGWQQLYEEHYTAKLQH
jgi:hypothetical protein